jgi:hypothetical protein
MMSRLLPIAFTVAVVTVASCASAIHVGAHIETGLTLSSYRTFSWGPTDALPTGDPRLDENPMFRRAVEAVVERELAGRGIERSNAGTADLLIHYHANLTKRFEVRRDGHNCGYGTRENCPPVVAEYEAGTLVLDVMDARRGTLVWRGWAQNWGLDILRDPESMGQSLDAALTRLLARLPGGL